MAQAKRKTIDEKFNAEYAKKGLQPFVSTDGRIRSGKKERKNFNSEKAANDQTYTQSTQSNVVPFPQPNNRVVRQTRRVSSQPATKNRAQKIAPKDSASAKKKARLKARAINRAVTPPLWSVYMGFQLPFALLSIFMFVAVYVALSAKDTFLGSFFGFFSGALDLPSMLYGAIVIVMFAYGIIILFSLAGAYHGAGIKSLSGKAPAAKQMAFIACLFGYFWPIFNLFPWVFIWMFVVEKNPT